MKCKELRSLFSGFYDNELVSKTKKSAQKHFSHCETCCDEYEIFKKGISIIRKLKPLEPS